MKSAILDVIIPMRAVSVGRRTKLIIVAGVGLNIRMYLSLIHLVFGIADCLSAGYTPNGSYALNVVCCLFRVAGNCTQDPA